MKIVGLMRHAKSDWDDLATRDFDRGLNDRGRKGGALIGAHIRDHGVKWGAILASPAERVKRTLDVAELPQTPVFDKKLYLASAPTIMDVIHTHMAGSDADAVLITGHNPGLQEMLMELVPPHRENALFDEAAAKFPTAAFAVIECKIDEWSELRGGVGTLAHFARPRDLDPDLGPEY
ncbi:MAG: histidine phosphatase family protein [Marinomonas sp.]